MSDVVAGQDYYKGVPGWCGFEHSYRWAVENATRQVFEDGRKEQFRFVEVGSWLGKSACLMAELIQSAGIDVDFTCVDPWIDGGPDLRETNYFKELKSTPYELFLRHTAPYRHIIKPLRMFSVEAAELFEDGSIDYIMLDGDHNYPGVKADIAAWLPKMRKGSVMAGDDYLWPGVEKAVRERFGIGHNSVIKGGSRERYQLSVAYWWVQL